MISDSLAAYRPALHRSAWCVAAIVIGLGVARFWFISQAGAETSLGPLTWLDIGAESSLGAWWTSLLWSASALLCFLLFRIDRSRWRFYWAALSVGALLLSLDETVQLHEQFAPVALMVMANPTGIWGTGWVVAAVPIVLTCLVLLIPFLLHLPRRTAVGLFSAGAIFIAGSVGMEMLFGLAALEWLSPASIIVTMVVVEEALEIIGVTIFMLILFDELTARARDALPPALSEEAD